MDVYEPHGTILRPELLAAIRRRDCGEIAGHRVFAIDGAVVRDFVYPDFVAGGNEGRYRFNPPGELWVEETMVPADFSAVLLHELDEKILMVAQGIDYDRAHEHATSVEVPYRRALRDRLVDKPRDHRAAVRAAERWFEARVVARRVVEESRRAGRR